MGNDGLVKLRDLDRVLQKAARAEQGKLIPVRAMASLQGHSGAAYGLALRSDGRLLATTGLDRTVRVWDLDFLDEPAGNSQVRRFTRAMRK